MTERQLCDLVYEVTGKPEKDLPRFRIIALAKLALHRLTQIIAKATDDPKMAAVQMHAQALRQMARKDFTVSIVAGVGNLVTVKTAAEPLAIEHIHQSEVSFSGIARQGQGLPDRASLNWDQPPGFPFYAIAGDEMHVRYNGTSPTTTATIRGPVVRSLANIPPLLDDDFVQIVAFMTTPQGKALTELQAATES